MPTRRDTFWQTLLGPLSRRQRRALRHGSHSSARRRPAGVSHETLESRIALAADAHPYVVSMNAAVKSTYATDMTWTAVFSEPVTGVDPADFQISYTGDLANGAISVTPAAGGANYTIKASGLTGTGTATLKLVDDGSIRDASNQMLTGELTFAAPSLSETSLDGPSIRRTGDFDRDGFDDVGITAFEPDADGKHRITLIARGSPDGLLPSTIYNTDFFTGGQNTAGGSETGFLAFPGDPDFNGDGRPDSFGQGLVYDYSLVRFTYDLWFLSGKADGSFDRLNDGHSIRIAGTDGWDLREPGKRIDLNGDGKLDIIVAKEQWSGAGWDYRWGFLLGNGDGTFQPLQTMGLMRQFLGTCDLNGDGRTDFLTRTVDAATLATTTTQAFLGNGDGTFAAPVETTTFYIDKLADFNGDGKTDIFGHTAGPKYSVKLSNGDGTFGVAKTSANATEFIDIDGDGKIDQYGVNASNNLVVNLGNGDGTFKAGKIINSYFLFSQWGDFNGDGRLDYAYFNGTSIAFTPNTTKGDFTGAAVTRELRPGVPTDLSAIAKNASVALTWTAPTATGGAAVTDYLVQSSKDNGTTWTTFVHTKSTATAITVTGLTNGTPYVFRVAAVTSIGTGDLSDPSLPATPVGPPAAPAKPTATAGDASALVKWAAPSDGGSPITGYWVRWSNDGGATWPAANLLLCPDTSLSVTIANLTNGIPWVFGVAAVNNLAVGAFSPTSAAVTPLARPSTPTNLRATPDNTKVTLTWTASDPGAKPLTDYSVQSSKDGGVTWTSFAHTASTATTITVTGLTNGTAYLFRVAGVSAAGTGVYTTPVGPVTPATLPGVPTTITGVTDGPGQVTLTWKAPTATGGSAITDYRVQSSTDAGVTWSDFAHDPAVISTPVAGSKRISVTGLAVATPVIFRVAAINGVGTGANSLNSASFTPIDVPGAPSNLVPAVVIGDATIKLTWTAPTANGGGALKQYRIETSTDGGASVSSTVLTPSATSATITISGFTPGTFYNFRVAAVNAAGVGAFTPYSAAVKAVARPGVPTNLAAVAGNASASLTWTAPANDGSSPITTYAVQSSKDGGVTWATFAHAASTLTSINVTGLVNGTSYVFRVAAVNAMGTGNYTAATAAVVPMTVPGAPTALVATKGDSQVSLAWTAPAVTGGSAISDYSVQFSTDNGVTWTTFIHDPSTTAAIVVTGLTNGKSYVFRVAAVNAKGIGTYTAKTAAVIPSV